MKRVRLAMTRRAGHFAADVDVTVIHVPQRLMPLPPAPLADLVNCCG